MTHQNVNTANNSHSTPREISLDAYAQYETLYINTYQYINNYQ